MRTAIPTPNAQTIADRQRHPEAGLSEHDTTDDRDRTPLDKLPAHLSGVDIDSLGRATYTAGPLAPGAASPEASHSRSADPGYKRVPIQN